jgi:hypothetical protein
VNKEIRIQKGLTTCSNCYCQCTSELDLILNNSFLPSFLLFSFFGVLEFEVRALCLLGRPSITGVTPPDVQLAFQVGSSIFCLFCFVFHLGQPQALILLYMTSVIAGMTDVGHQSRLLGCNEGLVSFFFAWPDFEL